MLPIIKTEAYYKASGEEAWKLGLLGNLLKHIKWLAALTVLLLVLLWLKFDMSSSGTTTINQQLIVNGLMTISGIGLVSGLWYLRRRTVRSLGIKASLHDFSHLLRNWNTQLHAKSSSAEVNLNTDADELLREMLSDVCNSISKQFRQIKSCDGINVAVRLAHWDDEAETVVYATIARSEGFSRGRAETSEVIPFNVGIPRFFLVEKERQGILIYYDIQEAARKRHTYLLTRNDTLYPDDIKSMMVAPLNAWAGDEQDMIGIIYLTSRKKKAFSVKDLSQFAFCSDLTATAISSAFDIFELAMIERSCNDSKSPT